MLLVGVAEDLGALPVSQYSQNLPCGLEMSLSGVGYLSHEPVVGDPGYYDYDVQSIQAFKQNKTTRPTQNHKTRAKTFSTHLTHKTVAFNSASIDVFPF